MRGDRRWIVLVVCLALLCVSVPAAGAEPDRPGDGVHRAYRTPGTLSSHVLRDLVAADAAGRSSPPGLEVRGGSVVVEALASESIASTEDAVRAVGGRVRASATELVLAEVPIRALARLEAHRAVKSVRPPLTISEPIGDARGTAVEDAPTSTLATTPAPVGQEVQKTNAAAWHDAGFTGAGVRIGIIDAFDQGEWGWLQTRGQVPVPAGTFCRWNGLTESMWSGCWDPYPHGNAVAEVIHEMAPDAQLYLAEVLTTADLAAAIDWFAANDVAIVSRSETSEYDGPGDGTGPLAAEISRAIDLGMTWVNAAGNASGTETSPIHSGAYWRGSYRDIDGDGWVEIQRRGGTYPPSTHDPSVPDDSELLPVLCTPGGVFVNGLRWSDWGQGSATSDYDTLTFDTEFPDHWSDAIHISDGSQGSDNPSGDPIEYPQIGACSTKRFRAVAIAVWELNGGGTGDTFELMVNGSNLDWTDWSNPYAAAAPGVDLARAGHLGVGAIGPDPLLTELASYSSWGPTNDGRIKPDVTAASCVTSSTYSPCFNGTSAAAPAVAGAAALVLGAGFATRGDALGTWLRTHATVDRGAIGPDNKYGAGELVLPAPVVVAPLNDAFADATTVVGSSGTALGTNIGATAEAGEPAHAGSAAAKSVWYRWTAPDTGTLDLDTSGSGFDTRLALYTGTNVSTLVPLGASIDAIGGAPVTQDTVYRVAVDGAPTNDGYAAGAITLSWSLTPYTAPDSPTGVVATAGNGDATVSWSPPASDGGSPITSYRVTALVGGAAVGMPTTVSGTTTDATVSGLTNGTEYTFTVAAMNSVGTGPESTPSNAVTPRGVDVQSPQVFLIEPAATYSMSRVVRGEWDGTDDIGIFGFDPDLRATPWNGSPGAWLEWKPLGTATAASYWGAYGRTYCVRVVAHDGAHNVSSPARRCTAVPLHSGHLSYAGDWTKYSSSATFAGAARWTTTRGATATRTGVVGERLAVIATRCPSCGAIEVRINGVVMRRFSLYAPTMQRSQALEFFTRAWPIRGTVSVHVISTNRLVTIEGLAVYQD